MSGRWASTVAAVVLGFSLAAVCVRADATDWSRQAELLLAQPGKGIEAVAYLRSLPLEIRKTADQVWMAARAHMAANEPENAAIHAATYRLLSQVQPKELRTVQDWLSQQSETSYRNAIEAWNRGDKDRAGELYFTGLLCNQAILGRDDRGLAPRAQNVLDRLIRQMPTRTRLWFALGFYHYFFSHLEAAEKALHYYVQKETDPYKRWVVEVWLARTQAEMAIERAQADQERQQRAAQEAARSKEEEQTQEVARARDLERLRKAEVDRQADERAQKMLRRQGLEADIRSVDTEIMVLERESLPRVTVGIDGQSLGITTVNRTLLRKQLEELNQKRQRLQEQLADVQ